MLTRRPTTTTKNKHNSVFHALNLWSVGFVCVRMHNSSVTCSGRRSRISTMTIAYGTVSALAILPNIYWAFIIQIWKWMCFPLRGATSQSSWVRWIRWLSKILVIYQWQHRWKFILFKNWTAKTLHFVRLCAHGVVSGHTNNKNLFSDFDQFRCTLFSFACMRV